jgi:thiamine transporter ThiT
MNSKFSASSFVSQIKRYGAALVMVAVALVLTLMIWSFVKPLASPLFLVAIIITAWRNGLRAGIFATLASGFIIDYFSFRSSINSADTPMTSFALRFSRLKASFCAGSSRGAPTPPKK